MKDWLTFIITAAIIFAVGWLVWYRAVPAAKRAL